MAKRARRLRRKLSAQKLRVKRLTMRMKEGARKRRAHDAWHAGETPIALRSRFAWITILLAVLVIVAASIRTHPTHFRIEYAMTQTGENPYMGTLDAEDGYLVSVPVRWSALEREDGCVWQIGGDPLEGARTLDEGQAYVVLLDGGSVPGHIGREAAQRVDGPQYVAERLRTFVQAFAGYLDERGDCAYVQTDSDITGLPVSVGGVYMLCRSSSGLYHVAAGDEVERQALPAAGSSDDIFGNRLTYLTDAAGGELEGRVGYALGVRYAEWHNSTRQGYRLFVNMRLDNAGVEALHHPMDMALTLHGADGVRVRQVQPIDLRSITNEPVALDGYIDIPHDLPGGRYDLCVSVSMPDAEAPVMSLTMPGGEDGYYRLGEVTVK